MLFSASSMMKKYSYLFYTLSWGVVESDKRKKTAPNVLRTAFLGSVPPSVFRSSLQTAFKNRPLVKNHTYLDHKTDCHRFCAQLNNYDLQLNNKCDKQLFIDLGMRTYYAFSLHFLISRCLNINFV